MANFKFLLNGCYICFYAKAPKDITLKEFEKMDYESYFPETVMEKGAQQD